MVVLAGAIVLAGLIAIAGSASPEPPRVLIGMTKTAQQYAATQPADNSRCFVCHKNYQKERLVVVGSPGTELEFAL